MCTGRVDLEFVIRALQKGADGVIIGGCWPGECHYVTEGNYDALGNVHLVRRVLEHIGVRPERVRIEWISAAEGARFAEVMSDFVSQTRRLGPLGQAEGVARDTLALRLESVRRLVPYLKLVEREKLRVAAKSEKAYLALHAGDEASRLFAELIAEPLATSLVLGLLERSPLSMGELSECLGLSPAETARHVGSSARRGLVRYDVDQKRYALARDASPDGVPSA